MLAARLTILLSTSRCLTKAGTAGLEQTKVVSVATRSAPSRNLAKALPLSFNRLVKKRGMTLAYAQRQMASGSKPIMISATKVERAVIITVRPTPLYFAARVKTLALKRS